MADDLRGKWKETGVSLGHAFRDLGKTLIKTATTGVQKAEQWANSEDNADQAGEAAAEKKDEE